MARAAQILLVVVVCMVVHSYAARRFPHPGRSHGRYRYDYPSRHRGNRYRENNRHSHRTSPVTETTTVIPFSDITTELTPENDPNIASAPDANPVDVAVNNDDSAHEPDNVPTINVGGSSSSNEQPEDTGNSIDVNGMSPEENGANPTENVDEGSNNEGNSIDVIGGSTGSEEKPDLNENGNVEMPNTGIDVNGISPGDGDIGLGGHLPNIDGGISSGNGNLGLGGHLPNIGGGISPSFGNVGLGGHLPNVGGGIPSGNGNIGLGGHLPNTGGGISPGFGNIGLAGHLPNVNGGIPSGNGNIGLGGHLPNVGGNVNVGLGGNLPNAGIGGGNGLFPGHHEKPNDILTPNENLPDEINSNGSSEENNDHDQPSREDSSHDNDGDVDISSPSGDLSKPNDSNNNFNGLSPGGNDVSDHNNSGNGRLPSSDLGDGPNGGHIGVGNEIDPGIVHPAPGDHLIDPEFNQPLPGDHSIDPGFIQPAPGDHLIDPGFLQPLPADHDIDKHFIHPEEPKPIFPGDDILNWPNGKEEKPGFDDSGKVDVNDLNGKKNNSLLIPVQLPNGGQAYIHAGALGSLPSYILVMINGQPTLVQNPGVGGLAGLGISGIGGGLDLSKLIFGNGLSVGSIGNINGGATLPSWINLAGLGGGSSGVTLLPSLNRPIFIGQYPSFGAGVGGGPIIIPKEEPVPVPIPVPRPIPAPQPLLEPFPIPTPNPGYVNFPGLPWPTLWNIGQPGLNINQTHHVSMQNPDWSILIHLLQKLDSRLPKQSDSNSQPSQPQPNQNIPPYPYNPYVYPPYPYLPPWYYDNFKPPHGDDSKNHKPDEPVIEPWVVPRPRPENPGDHDFKPEEPLSPVPNNPVTPGSNPDEHVREPWVVPRPHPEIPGDHDFEPEGPLRPVPNNPVTPGPKPDEPEREPWTEPSQPNRENPDNHVPNTDKPETEPWKEPSRPNPENPGYHVPDGPVREPWGEPSRPNPENPNNHESKPDQPETEPWKEPSRPNPQNPDNHGSKPDEPVREPWVEPLPTSEKPATPAPKLDEPVTKPWTEPPIPKHPEDYGTTPEEPPKEPWTERPPVTEGPYVPQTDEPVREPWTERPRPNVENPDINIPKSEEPDQPTKPEKEPVVTEKPVIPEPKLDEPGDSGTERPRPRPQPGRPEIDQGSKDETNNRPDRPRPGYQIPPHIHIPFPKPKPGKTGLNNGLIDILNILLKFPSRVPVTTQPPQNLGAIVNLLLSILKSGDNKSVQLPNLTEVSKGDGNFGNLAHLLLHILDGRNEPNVNVLVEPGMDEATRNNLILLLNLLASHLANNYHEMGYFESGNPLLYFLGHFPCDHPNISAISGMDSNSNLWQLLSSMYGHHFELPELRLERSAEEGGDKPAVIAEDSNKKN